MSFPTRAYGIFFRSYVRHPRNVRAYSCCYIDVFSEVPDEILRAYLRGSDISNCLCVCARVFTLCGRAYNSLYCEDVVVLITMN